MRRIMLGLVDRAALPGPITGSGPGFARAMRLFKARQERASRPGQWRKAPCTWKKRDGDFIDPEWCIVNYGQEDES